MDISISHLNDGGLWFLGDFLGNYAPKILVKV